MPDLRRRFWARGAALCLFLSFTTAAAVDMEDRAERLALQMERGMTSGEAAGQAFREPALLREFYANHDAQSLWVAPQGLRETAREMLSVLQGVEYEGLQPAAYHRPAIRGLLDAIETEAEEAIAEQLAVRKAREQEIAEEMALLAANQEAEQAADADDEEPEEDVDDEGDVDDEEEASDDDDDGAASDDDEDDGQSEEEAAEKTVEPEAAITTHAEALPPPVAPPPRVELMADLELLLTDAFLHLARHRGSGVVQPQALEIGWHLAERKTDPLAALREAAKSGTVRASLQALKPPAPEYLALETALQRYLALAEKGRWQAIGGGRLLKEDMSDGRIVHVRKRLAVSGDFNGATPEDPEDYDATLVEAVKHFQQRHGLKPDGVIGPKTVYMLNMSLHDKITALKANLERWRWMPENLGSPHIRVNVAAFHMEVIENGERVLDMPTIVGMPDRRTPNFSETMKYLVANPTWEVPPSIAKKDKIPIIQQNLAYLSEHGFQVLEGWGEKETLIDAATVDWGKYNEEAHFPYHLRQLPGPTNALGRIKFMLPNRFNIYLHDTPAKHLFDAETRTFSSGCIRLQRPLELADYILGRDPRWKDKDIREILKGEPKQILRLKQHIPVHILYNTAWVDAQGVVHFREDVYNRNQAVIDAMHQGIGG